MMLLIIACLSRILLIITCGIDFIDHSLLVYDVIDIKSPGYDATGPNVLD